MSQALSAAALQDHLMRRFKITRPVRRRRSKRTRPRRGVTSSSSGAHSSSMPKFWTCDRCTLRNSGPRCAACFAAPPVPVGEDELNPAREPLTLAQRMHLVPRPPEPLTDDAWNAIEERSKARGDSKEPCPICLAPFGSEKQVILSCSHVYHLACLRSFESFVRSSERSCPVCRKSEYEKRYHGEGLRVHKTKSATIIQCAVRRMLQRKKYLARLEKLYESGGGVEERCVCVCVFVCF